MFCKHQWKVLSETMTESKIEHAVNMGLGIKSGSSVAMERKFIQIIQCEKCGKLKRFVEEV